MRSSATAEDLPGLSFAGQQETYLNIRGVAALQEQVKRCWASLWTARAIGYRAQHNIAPATVSLAVVVQLLMPAAAAGILFTANPVNGDRTQALISASWGLGEAIVSGLVTPDTLTVDKASGRILEHAIADKQTMTVRTVSGTAETPVPEAQRTTPVLDDQAARELVYLGVQVETLYGIPMDIEWTLTGAVFNLVQARPITALPTAEPPAPTTWLLPDPKGQYARSSIIELLPDPLTPLFATLGLRQVNSSYQELGVNLLGAPEIFSQQVDNASKAPTADKHFRLRRTVLACPG